MIGAAPPNRLVPFFSLGLTTRFRKLAWQADRDFPKSEPYCSDRRATTVQFLSMALEASPLNPRSPQQQSPSGNRRMIWQGDSKCVLFVCRCLHF